MHTTGVTNIFTKRCAMTLMRLKIPTIKKFMCVNNAACLLVMLYTLARMRHSCMKNVWLKIMPVGGMKKSVLFRVRIWH